MKVLPKIGKFVSEDRNFTIEITKADPKNSDLEVNYKANFSPKGAFTQKAQKGHFYHVRTGKAPFAMDVEVINRPEGHAYCILDNWTGVYKEDNTLWMEGARSFVNENGEIETLNLGRLKFSLS